MQIIRDTSDIVPEMCVAAIGFFDGVHLGHRYLIRQVKEIAAARGLRSALITFPVHPRKVMCTDYRPELLTTFEEKTALLSDMEIDYCLMVDFTLEISQLSAEEFMRSVLKDRFRVKCLVIGYDHRFGHNRSEGFAEYVKYGQAMDMEIVHALAYTERQLSQNDETVTISSSLIRRLLWQGNVSTAADCLGYFYFLEGKVVNGYHVGRKIGFPTANLSVNSPDKLIPQNGVYAVLVTIDGKEYMGMLNIGVRPTVNNGVNRTIEVHILHFDADIYGKSIRLTFVERIRPELRFSSLQALTDELQKDAETVERILTSRTEK